MKNGMAILEEFLQEKYVELYDDVKDDDNKVLALINNSTTSNYFYKPDMGALQYIVDSEGHALYLINKDGLPKEIKQSLVGGEAGNKKYSDYASLIDVYGVTTDLKVYYCSNGVDSLYGLSKEDLDNDNPLRVVFEKGSEFAELITGENDKDVKAEDLKNVKDLNIDGSSISSLKDLYNLTSLQSLRLQNYTGSLEGLENTIQLSEILIENPNITNYSPIGMLGSKLTKLYFYNTTDSEIEKLCSKTSIGISNYDLPNLQYFGIMGYLLIYDRSYTEGGITSGVNEKKTENTITNVLNLNNFSDTTKKAIKYLFLNNNDIESLTGLEDFTNVYAIRAEYNQLKTLKGLENMVGKGENIGLTYIIACNNLLGEDEVYNTELANDGKNSETDCLSYIYNCEDLYYINVNSNKIKWTDYINNLSALKEFHIGSNTGICDVPSIKSKIFSCSKYTIDSIYSLDLIDENITTKLDLKDYTLKLSNLEAIKKCSKLTALRLDNIKLTDNGGTEIVDENDFNNYLNIFLSSLTGMMDLSLNDISLLNSISFIENMNNIRALGLLNTNVTDLNVLNSKTTLRTLGINNINIDLKNIQTTINRLNATTSAWFGNTYGLFIDNFQLLIKIKECKDIETLAVFWHDDRNVVGGETLDLTGCTSLKYFRGCHFNYHVIFPESLIEMKEWAYTNLLPDFSNCTNLTKICFGLDTWSNGINVETMIRSLANCSSLNILDLSRVQFFENLNMFECFDGLSNFKELKIGGYDYTYNSTLKSLLGIGNLSFLENLTINCCSSLTDLSSLSLLTKLKNLTIYKVPNFKSIPSLINSVETLTTISITNCKISDISGITGLKLTSLTLSDNNVSNLKALENMTTLASLDLKNNTIYDTFSYLDEGDVMRIENNIDILVNLNRSGALRTLTLTGNKGITSHSKLQALQWSKLEI